MKDLVSNHKPADQTKYAVMGRGMNKRMLYVYIGAVILYLSTNSRLTDFALGVLAAYIVEQFGESIKSHASIL